MGSWNLGGYGVIYNAGIPNLCVGFIKFAHKIFCHMENTSTKTRKSTGLWWLLFLVSCGVLAFAIYIHWEYLTMILPFVCFFLAKALDLLDEQ